MLDTPLHPATVHFPIAFLSLAWVLDVLYGLSTQVSLPYLSSLHSSLPEIARASYYLLAIGLITVLPAVATGAQQLIAMQSNGQAFEADNKTMRPKFKIALLHAGLNDTVGLLAAYNWYLKRSIVGYLPAGENVLLSAICLPIVSYSANLGGKLVYHHGMGVNFAKARKEKAK